ncbi:lipid A biosynthesis lauroyl acyltransferase [Corynebacterium phocae]|uniref:Lipid A biosynthesis lauroyl acyltransferase n=2 Tax=Corynebacterium phocae TaxID=161895 RepID=A0A1L7D6B5_9CORY|nr:lipid A biosynthesis lauroyl acyltransferase [Corynebacterium phocae]
MRFLPERLATRLFDVIADIASDHGRGLDQLRRNLSRVVGPENVSRELVRGSMRSYMRYWKEAFRLPTMSADPALFARLMDGVEGEEYFNASTARGKGVILALTHSGNWDMAGTFLVNHWGPFTTVAERLRPEALFDAFVDYRHSLGFNVIPHVSKESGATAPFAVLKQTLEDGGVVCLLAERDLSRTGITVDFFGEEANMAAGPAVLARETGAALHVVHSWFTEDGWGLSCSPPLEVEDPQTTTQAMADIFARNIAQHPQDWHMLQPVWNSDVLRRKRLRSQQAARSLKQRKA